jgi:hypothetical protein
MLIINECRTCNADKETCPIRTGLRIKLANIKERLKYKCKGWQKHLEYNIGDKISFHFIEHGEHGGELSGETLTGVVVDINKKRPVYYVMIDQDNRNLIDPEYSIYDKYVQPYVTIEDGYGIDHPGFYTVPVKEELICCIAE